MNCPKCNHENPGGAKFCSNCATQLCQVCPSCNATNIPIEAKFCPVCGATLNAVNTPKNVAEATSKQLSHKTDKELLPLALEEYAEEYQSFKKKWMIGIIIGCVLYVIPGILAFFAYKNYFLPQYEQELLQQYKRNHKLQ